MTYHPSRRDIAALKKHERSTYAYSPDVLAYLRSLRQPALEMASLAGWPGSAAAFRGLDGPLLPLVWTALRETARLWAERRAARRMLALASVRDLADLGLSPAQATFEASRPVWQALPAGDRRG